MGYAAAISCTSTQAQCLRSDTAGLVSVLDDEEAATGRSVRDGPSATTEIVTPSERFCDGAIDGKCDNISSSAEIDERAPLIRRTADPGPKPPTVLDKYCRSTFGQTLFNCVAMLVGIGLLSAPVALSHTGWVMGTVLILSYGFITCYTAKVLGRIMLADTSLRCYSDIGRKAFGTWSTPWISLMFCLELFAISVLLVTLAADSLHSLLPQFSSDAYKLWSLVLLLPTMFLPLSMLSYSSILGILSTSLIVIVILVDGLTKYTTPGSLWDPAATSIGMSSWGNVGIAFGLFIAGFGCHPLIPSLARDMMEPQRFERMINLAFAIATVIYSLVAVAGYLMFGNAVSGELSVDLLQTHGYNKLLNHLALWMLVLSPLSKFALTTQPLSATLEILLRIDVPRHSLSEEMGKMSAAQVSRENIKRGLRIVQRICVTVLSVMLSILVPGFSDILAFLGCSSAFMLCVIGPLAAEVSISRECRMFDGLVMTVSLFMAVWGTIALFM